MISEKKNTVDEINSRLDTVEENISELEHSNRNFQNEVTGKTKTRTKKEENISELWDNFKQPNINVIGVSKRERAYKIFE